MALSVATPGIPATVAVIAKEKEGEYGPCRSVLFVGAGLPQADRDGNPALWRTLSSKECESLRKGLKVILKQGMTAPRDGSQPRPKWDIEICPGQELPAAAAPAALPAPAVPNTAPAPAGLTPGGNHLIPDLQKRQIMDFMVQQGQLHAAAYGVAKQAYEDQGHQVPDAHLQAATAAIFISTCKKFNIDYR